MEEDLTNLFPPTPPPGAPPPGASSQAPTPTGKRQKPYVPPINPTSAALDDLSPAQHKSIVGVVPVDHMLVYVSKLLFKIPKRAKAIRLELCQYDWFPKHASLDTQLRTMRTLRAAAESQDYLICASNKGIYLGDVNDLLASADREERRGRGSLARAARQRKRAAKILAKAGQP
jgi:hypothetical protein